MSIDKFDILFSPDKERLTNSFNSKHAKMLSTSNTFQEGVKTYRQRGWHLHADIWNIAFFLNLVAHDVSVLTFQVANETEPWARKLAARHLALAAYETVEDMTQLLGKPIREPLQKLQLLNSFDQELRQARKPLDNFWKGHGPVLKEIRDAAGAHRDHDAIALFQFIDGIDVFKIMKIGLELTDIHNELGPFMFSILTNIVKIPPPQNV